ncbi:hypothetical protein QVA66_04005 [Staphylococcus chromogenes]|nr:hypothetical protein [Staphylococcus chromogenes]
MKMTWRSRANPWCMIGFAWLAVVRGIVYFAGAFGTRYKIPAAIEIVFEAHWQLGLAGITWIVAGLIFGGATLTGYRLRDATALLIGVKSMWAVMHLAALVLEPSWNTVLSLSIHLVLICCLFTFVQQEISKHRDRFEGVHGDHE